MLKVAKKTEDKLYHIVKIKKWKYGGEYHLTTLMIQFFCEEDVVDRTPRKGYSTNYKIIDINKDKQKFCEDCVKGIKDYKRRINLQKKLAAQRKS